jgi:hypothetical protein
MAPLVSGRAVPGRAVVLRAAATSAVAGLALLIAAAPSLAVVTAEIEFGDTVTITTTAADDNVTVSCLAGEVSVESTPPLPPFPCADVRYVDVLADDEVGSVNLGGVTRLAFPALLETSVRAEDGLAGSVTGSEARDVVHADGADDVSTGLGDDWVEGAGSASGGPGDDTLRRILGAVQGGPGDDLIVSAGAGPFDGGDGRDTLVIDYSAFASQTVVGFVVTDVLINGSVQTSSIEDYEVTAADGAKADVVDSRRYSGRVAFHARGGDDNFLGGPGADLADLGFGNDTADPGPGSDFVLAGEGDDSVSVRDGFGDVVECGLGTDTVVADRSDVLSGCENVVLPPPETSRIEGPKKVTQGTKAFFAFSASVPSSTFECRLDSGPFRACSSPFKVKTRKLHPGRHTVTVRAVQPTANPDATPSAFTFKVRAKPKRKAQA